MVFYSGWRCDLGQHYTTEADDLYVGVILGVMLSFRYADSCL